MSIFAAPLGPPFTGVTPLGGQNPTGARKQECLGAVPSGPTGGLSGRKIGVGAVPLLRLGFRTNAPGTYAVGPVRDRPLPEKGTVSISAVGATLAVARCGETVSSVGAAPCGRPRAAEVVGPYEKAGAFPYFVGAAVGRLQAFPPGGRCPSAHTGADEGAMIERFFV